MSNSTCTLYIPKIDAGFHKRLLEIENPTAANIHGSGGTEIAERHRLRRRRRQTFVNYQQSLDYVDQPFHSLLGCFGKVIPTTNTSRRLENVRITTKPYDDEWIDLSLLCFHTLHRVAGIKIEWADCLSVHLEFDSYTRTLKVFRFPSLGLIMATPNKRSALSR